MPCVSILTISVILFWEFKLLTHGLIDGSCKSSTFFRLFSSVGKRDLRLNLVENLSTYFQTEQFKFLFVLVGNN